MRRQIRGSRAVVTGASSGIGRELALELARRGATLILNARRAERLTAVADEITSFGSTAVPVQGDITDPETRRKIVSAAKEMGGLDLLINNAGVGAHGPFAEAPADRLRRIMEVNFFAPVELIRDSLPVLLEATRPMIVNVSSVLGHRAVPNRSEYCASKFALHGFSDSLRAELGRHQVDLLLVSPSTTESEFFDSVLDKGAKDHRKRRGMSTKTVARRTIRAIERGRHEIILPASGKMLVWLDRLCPTLADLLVARFGPD